VPPTTLARIADVVLRKADDLVGKLGAPVGIWSYKPYHSLGDDFLQNYLGMIGLPMDMYASFPEGRKSVILTAQAASDPDIVAKMEKQLRSGGDVLVTAGLVKAIPDKIADICELRVTDLKALVDDFGRYGKSTREILIPQIRYMTNDSWEVISAGRPLSGGVSGFPLLHKALYSGGYLYVLAVPDDPGQLYDLPEGVLNELRRIVSRDMDLYLEGPAKVSLFLYDNKTVIVENFNDTPVDVRLVGDPTLTRFVDLENGEVVPASAPQGPFVRTPKARAAVSLPAHSYRAFRYE
jgi:hypothetical protein